MRKNILLLGILVLALVLLTPNKVLARRNFDHIGNFNFRVKIEDFKDMNLLNPGWYGHCNSWFSVNENNPEIDTYAYGYDPNEAGDMKLLLPNGTTVTLKTLVDHPDLVDLKSVEPGKINEKP